MAKHGLGKTSENPGKLGLLDRLEDTSHSAVTGAPGSSFAYGPERSVVQIVEHRWIEADVSESYTPSMFLTQ